jgi:TBC1 domain family member 10
MDTFLRGYFSVNTTQLEVDATLFSKALENNDPQVFKKIMAEFSISPVKICYPWFTGLFVGSLPTEYMNRIWDLFLYEGVPFLIRVSLAMVYCCRRAILEATSEEAILNVLRKPSPNWLPPSTDAFLSLVFAMKLKDDDVKKQRVKMEAQVKRQTQRMTTVPTSISLPRS